MANAKKTTEKSTTPKQTYVEVKPPAGMQVISQYAIDGYYAPVAGSVVYGRIVGHLLKSKDDRIVTQALIKLGQPTNAQIKDEDGEYETKELAVGDILSVDITHALSKMANYITTNGIVWFQCKGKIKLKGIRTMWDYNVSVKGTPGPLPSQAAPGVSGDGDDLAPNTSDNMGGNAEAGDLPF